MSREHTDTWFFFGDSVTLGVNDNVIPGGWVSRLARMGREKGLYEFPPATFYNLGARRQTLSQISERFAGEYGARQMPGIRSRFVFCTGTVDALQGHAPEDTAHELASLLQSARGMAPTLFICPPPLANEAANERLSRFADLAEGICRELDVPAVTLFNTLMERNFVQYLTDGIHPGPDGNELFASLLLADPRMTTFLTVD